MAKRHSYYIRDIWHGRPSEVLRKLHLNLFEKWKLEAVAKTMYNVAILNSYTVRSLPSLFEVREILRGVKHKSKKHVLLVSVVHEFPAERDIQALAISYCGGAFLPERTNFISELNAKAWNISGNGGVQDCEVIHFLKKINIQSSEDTVSQSKQFHSFAARMFINSAIFSHIRLNSSVCRQWFCSHYIFMWTALHLVAVATEMSLFQVCLALASECISPPNTSWSQRSNRQIDRGETNILQNCE